MTYPSFSSGEVLTAADMNAVGLWKVGETTFTNQASPIYNNIFTTNYDVYRLVIRVGVASSGTNAYLRMRLVNSGGTVQTTNYVAKSLWSNTGVANTVFADQDTSSITFPLGPIGNTDNPGSMSVDIYNPFSSGSFTLYNGNFFGTQNGVANYMGLFGGAHQVVASYTGLNFIATTGNISGTVAVYGYRKA
jgi:hypothetical protein